MIRALAACLIIALVLTFAGWTGECLEVNQQLNGQRRLLLQGAIMSGLIIPTAYLMRMRLDRGVPASIGAGKLLRGLRFFGLGLCVFGLPFSGTL